MRYDPVAYKLSQQNPRCTAITWEGNQCTILVTNSPDDRVLCHVHHPLRTYQMQKQGHKAFVHFRDLNK